MATPEQRFIVFNYVTSRAEQSEVAPDYGDPNAQIQSLVTQAYAGSQIGATTLSAATPMGPSVATLATPAAELVSVAQGSALIPPAQVAQLQQALGGLDQVGALPGMIANMRAHATNVLDNGARVFEAVNITYQPDQVNTPNRCTNLGDFIGSVQGRYNGVLGTVVGSLGAITSALVSIPAAVIASFVTIVTGTIAAIQTGVQSVINASIEALNGVTTQLFGGLSRQIQSVIQETGAAITQVQTAIQSEIDAVAGALAAVLNNPFRLVTPNVNPCLSQILTASNTGNFPVPSVAVPGVAVPTVDV